jgi:hypothetical protein
MQLIPSINRYERPLSPSFLVFSLTAYRLIISQNLTAMSRIRKTLSNSDTSSTRLTTSLADQCFCTSVERRVAKVDSRTCKLEVCIHFLLKDRKYMLIEPVIQIMMQKFNGLGVILENRYYGQSYPYNTSSTDELRFLTTEQSEYNLLYYLVH